MRAIYKDFHPVNTFRAVNIPSLQVNCSIIADKNAESGEKKRENAFEFAYKVVILQQSFRINES